MKSSRGFLLFCTLTLCAQICGAKSFDFRKDTLAFENSTVFEYSGGQKTQKKGEKEKDKPYTRRCFVMSRVVWQFYKFARFEPKGRPLDDKTLATRLRDLAHRQAWLPALPPNERIVFPGYPNLRALSKARAEVFQENIGLGWPTYARIGNFRMFFRRDDDGYQVRQHQVLNQTLDRGEFFVAYLSDYPHFRINHAVLVYQRIPAKRPNGIEHYLVYDPNHADRPRDLKWSPTEKIFNYEKDEEFVGGYTRVYQVYGKAWQ